MILIYRDNNANAIFVEDNNGAQFLNNLQAIQDNPTDSTLSIKNISRDIDIMTDIDYTEFEDDNGTAWGSDGQTTTNNLNAIFQTTGGGGGNVPVITSPLTINLTTGNTINYELIATDGVGYEWDLSNVLGITTVDGNNRKIIGGSALSAGTYNIPVKAINYNGEDSETIVLTVSSPQFANTKSIQFNNNDYLGANAALLDSVLGRSGNGSGSSDAWTISFWFKAGTSVNNNQTIFYFGSNNVTNGNHIKITYQGGVSNGRNINFKYGSNVNYLNLITPLSSVPQNSWCHVMITYDGGTTGSSNVSINDYYSRFKIFIDGSQKTTSNFNLNYGNTTSLSGQNLRVGRYNSVHYMLNSCKIDELALFDSDQSSNISDIYNSGVPFDLSTLTTEPKHWWRMGDGDTFPTISDKVASLDFTMVNMTVADFVSDVP